MKKLRIYKTSLRARITIVTVLMISAIAVVLTFFTMYKANYLVFSTTDILPSIGAVHVEDMIPIEDPAVNISSEAGTGFFAPGFEAQAATVPAQALVEAQQAAPAQSITDTDKLSAHAITVSSAFVDGTFSVSPAVTLAVQDFNIVLLVVMITIIAAGGFATWLALGRALRPVKSLSEEIGGISENDLSVRITDFRAGDEINRLADSFNHMLERLDKAFAGQKGFASAAAHELKTPLSAIKANIEVLELEKQPDAEEYAQTISVVKKQTGRMIALVDELLELAADKEQAAEELLLAPVLKEAAEALAHEAAEYRTNISIEAEEGCRGVANRELLLRAVENIISNAIKYGSRGGSVAVCAKQTESEAYITVADNGPGVPKEYRESIFEPFFRVDASRSRKAGGAGLGLAIAKDALTRQGGSIEYIENKEGGSIFKITLPR